MHVGLEEVDLVSPVSILSKSPAIDFICQRIHFVHFKIAII